MKNKLVYNICNGLIKFSSMPNGDFIRILIRSCSDRFAKKFDRIVNYYHDYFIDSDMILGDLMEIPREKFVEVYSAIVTALMDDELDTLLNTKWRSYVYGEKEKMISRYKTYDGSFRVLFIADDTIKIKIVNKDLDELYLIRTYLKRRGFDYMLDTNKLTLTIWSTKEKFVPLYMYLIYKIVEYDIFNLAKIGRIPMVWYDRD